MNSLNELKTIINEASERGKMFVGDDSGYWEEGSPFGKKWCTWWMTAGIRKKGSKDYSVDGATRFHSGFLKALKEIVKEYPEVSEYKFYFDSPEGYKVDELLGGGAQ